jgi:putative protein-disulfide isomerase
MSETSSSTPVDPAIETEEDVHVLVPGTVIAIVDPLCGWCWGAAPALAKLAANPTTPVELVASGLFIGDREMTAEFADYAWKNDQRIRTLTGQTFSEAYRDKVLGKLDGKFDSGPATLGFTAVQLREPDKAMTAFHALQAARWVDGRDITDMGEVAAILAEAGAMSDTVAAFEAEDDAVIEALNLRATFARDLMARLGARGVPMIARVTQKGVDRIDSRWLFEDVDNVVMRATTPAGTA